MSVAARCLWLSRVRRAAIVRLQCAVVDRVGPGVNPQLMHLPIAGLGVAAHAASWGALAPMVRVSRLYSYYW